MYGPVTKKPLRIRPDYGECDASPEQPSYCEAVPRGYDGDEEKTSLDIRDVYSSLIRLGHTRPGLRRHLRPILRHLEASRSKTSRKDRLDQIRGEPGRMREILRVREDETIEDRYTPRRAVQRLVDALGEQEASSMINYVANYTQKDYFLRMQEMISQVEET